MAKKVNQEIKFGTDGWRGVISDNFTFKNVAVVAQSISNWVKKDLKPKVKGKPKRVAVGYDTRFLSREYAELVSCVLAKNGIEAYLSDAPIPTPALSYGVVTTKSVAGVMITASHNPAKFNGIKIKTDQGGGAGTDITSKVENDLFKTPARQMPLDQALEKKKVVMHNFKKDYMKFMRHYLDLKKMKNAKFKILTDVMHGSGGTLMEEAIKGTALRLSLMRSEINPYFSGAKPEPVKAYVGDLMKRVKSEKFDIGLILDGDADRIAAVDSTGEYLHPQKILGLLVLHLVRNRGRKGGIIKTICGQR
jgi:phosphomannomutase